MSARFDGVLGFLRRVLIGPLGRLGVASGAAVRSFVAAGCHLRTRLVIAALLVLCAYGLYAHPPFATVRRSEVLVRMNLLDGSTSAYTAGTLLLLPGIHQVRRYSTGDQIYRPIEGASAHSIDAAPTMSTTPTLEGVSTATRSPSVAPSVTVVAALGTMMPALRSPINAMNSPMPPATANGCWLQRPRCSPSAGLMCHWTK